MLPKLKKKPEKAKALAPAWHTNFRNYSVLPDTKLIRTSFFAGFICVTLAVLAFLAAAYQEYRLHYVKSELLVAEAQLERLRGPSAKAVAEYRQFLEEERKINEVAAFVSSQKVVVSDLFIHLSRTLPAGVALASIEYRESGAVIRGYVQGASEHAAGAASDYERLLKEDEKLQKLFVSIALTTLVRDQQANKHMFQIELSFQAGRAK